MLLYIQENSPGVVHNGSMSVKREEVRSGFTLAKAYCTETFHRLVEVK
jgi:hypothetical protein